MMVLSIVRRAGTWDVNMGAESARLTPAQCGENARYPVPVPVPRMVVLRDGANELNTASWRMTLSSSSTVRSTRTSKPSCADSTTRSCPRGSSGDSL